jgi:hypothetical protein
VVNLTAMNGGNETKDASRIQRSFKISAYNVNRNTVQQFSNATKHRIDVPKPFKEDKYTCERGTVFETSVWAMSL